MSSFFGRPPCRPRARAAASPACVRSRIRSRSNSARAPKTWKISLPPLVVVSICSVRLLKPTPPLVEPGHRLDEVPQRAPEPVEPPDDEDVALADIGEGLLQAEPLGTGAAGGVGEDLLAAGRGEGILLQVEDLFER